MEITRKSLQIYMGGKNNRLVASVDCIYGEYTITFADDGLIYDSILKSIEGGIDVIIPIKIGEIYIVADKKDEDFLLKFGKYLSYSFNYICDYSCDIQP